jgi:hypothetical protein
MTKTKDISSIGSVQNKRTFGQRLNLPPVSCMIIFIQKPPEGFKTTVEPGPDAPFRGPWQFLIGWGAVLTENVLISKNKIK